MEDKKILIEELFEKAIAYGETSIELVKLKVVDKSSSLISSIISRLILLLVFLMFLVIFSIGISLWIGELMGEIYYGFMVVAAFYLFLALLLILIHTSIKRKLVNAIITLLTHQHAKHQ